MGRGRLNPRDPLLRPVAFVISAVFLLALIALPPWDAFEGLPAGPTVAADWRADFGAYPSSSGWEMSAAVRHFFAAVGAVGLVALVGLSRAGPGFARRTLRVFRLSSPGTRQAEEPVEPVERVGGRARRLASRGPIVALSLVGLFVLAYLALSLVLATFLGAAETGASVGSMLAGVARDAVLLAVPAACVALLAVLLAALRPITWWRWLAVVAAAVAPLALLLQPLAVQPLLHDFESLSAEGTPEVLRDIADAHGPAGTQIVVASDDRGADFLAYATGFASSSRIVVSESLLALDDAQVSTVLAHELGHVRAGDAARTAILFAVGVAGAVILVALVGASERTRRRLGWQSLGSVEAVPAVVALVALVALVGGVTNQVVSRQMEERADVEALEATRDPETFVGLQLSLVLDSSRQPHPNWLERSIASHPSAAERIAVARTWALRTGEPVPIELAAGH